ncbi:Coenzyme F420 hydrogenase/dehydrogenase, beta subunit C-terminal domain [Enterococcus sp. CWB-B31]|uniref:Coenzyme F420 hydrogenase/dehydrogenase, beta subunit C-terminal domain n=1 Tax=Enterococcus sp. CWB-B31 TaxID=2885159 RepID=UPI001E465E93|nr:Coenzyme F420 hydrogenase/dehydrogenase, beta subunit C-terminal domain [Enterococcus sp. CWB-B31]MCB5954622.1 Coenzyme F420 hydrogenase/dehydrogenase, beta subunit C-terminal domain [Enterococcus sp. CWB-B31]
MAKNTTDNVLKNVIDGDYCSGCGLCAALDKRYTMEIDENGCIKANYRPSDSEQFSVERVCPFSNQSKNETELGELIFGDTKDIQQDVNLGFFLNTFVGNVKEDSYRLNGSSGGIGSWVTDKLLLSKKIDGVIHVKENPSADNVMYSYQVSYSVDETREGAKTKYYPIELSEVLRKIRGDGKTYGIVGVPCFIKGIRSACIQDPILSSQIKFTVGLVCGHLKSKLFSEAIGWECGVEPEKLEKIDFRKKLEGRKASDYGVEVFEKGSDKTDSKIVPTRSLSTTNWGLSYFKYNSCDYCDDVLAELADITIGDAWLPDYEQDSKGTNIVIIRNKEILDLFEENKSELDLKEVNKEEIVKSQAGGFRHRREGLKYRLFLKETANEWIPQKRVIPSSNHISEKRKKIYYYRTVLTKESFNGMKTAKKLSSFNEFQKYMKPFEKEYSKLNKVSFLRRIIRKAKRVIISS